MEWRSVLWCISVFSHLVFTTVTAQLSCSQEQYMYSPTSCLEIRGQDQRLSNQASQTECTSRGLTGLATFEEYEQFEALQGFVELLLEGSDPLWLGYYYDTNGNVLLRGSGELSESAVFGDAGNFAPGGVSAGGDDVCLAIGSNGQLQRRMCTDTFPYACYQDHAPRVTSITIDGSRFLTASETRTLTCNYQPSSADVSWRRNNMPVPDTSESMISTSSGQSTLTIIEFQQQDGLTVDLFECVVNNSVGGVVSEAIGLVEVQSAGSGTDVPVPTISSIETSPQQSDIRSGSSLTLTCMSNDTSAIYSWFRDGVRVVDSMTTNTFQLDRFLPGFYQCRAALSTGENSVYTIRLDARDPPKADDTISATPFNRTAILLGWSPPADFSRDPLLLRYTLFYTNNAPQFPLNSSTAESVPDLLPLLQNGSVSRNGRLEYVLSNLEIGTEYWISMRASYMELNGEESELFAFSPTYGHVPVATVSNLAVSRTQNNKSLLAQWDKLESQLPVGEIAVYQVEYRNKGKDIVMTARISATFDYFSIFELEDASAYEVRVRAGVQVSSDPLVYEFGQPTDWKLADSLVEVIPSPPPTLPVRTRLSDGVIAAIIVVVVLVVFLVAIIIAVGCIALFVKQKKAKDHGGSRGRTQSFAALKRNDENEKEGSPS